MNLARQQEMLVEELDVVNLSFFNPFFLLAFGSMYSLVFILSESKYLEKLEPKMQMK